jgi:hypothetical protein
MRNIANNLHNKIHKWIDAFGFRLNASQTNRNKKVTIKHYFFETFNFIEREYAEHPEKTKYMCFDAYGEQMSVHSLRDLQAAFFENISQLK